MKISSSALSAVNTTHATDPSFKSSHSRLYANVEPTSVSHPVKASVDNDDDSSFYSDGTEDSDDDSSIAAVLEMRTPKDTVKDIDVVAQRDDYHCIPGRPYGYDIEEKFQATSFLCAFGGQEWCSTQYTELANCGNFDDRSADAAYDFTTSTPKATPRSVKINENATCKDDDDDDDESHNGPRHSPSIESQFEKISKETPRPVKINKNNNRSGPLYTPYFESQFEAVCSTGERPLYFVALRSIKALNRDVVIPVTIEKPGSLGLIVKDNADGVVCVVDVSPWAMEACRVLHPGDILAYRNNEKEEVIPEIEVLIKNGPITSSNPNKTSDVMPSLYDKLEVRATTDMASLGGTNANKATFFAKILNNSKKNKWLYAYLSSCSLIQCGDSSTTDESTDEPAESLDGIPQIEAINPDVLLESESKTINSESLCDEGLDEAQEESAEEQPPKSRVVASRVISPDANLQSIEDEYFFGLKYIESMNSSDGSHLSTKEEDLIANKGIIPLLKSTGPERLADGLAEDIVSSIEAADIDAILDAVVEHLVFIFDRVIPDGKDDEDEYEDDDDDDSERLDYPNNIEPDMPSKALTTDKDFSAIRKNAKDRKGTKFLRKVRRYRLLLHKRLNRSTVLCSGVDNNTDAESYGEEYDSHSDNSDYSAEKGPGIKLSMPEFGKYAEQGAERLQTLQKAVGNLQLQSKLGQAMEDVASQVKSDSASGQENEQIKPAQASPEELAKAWRNGCERALQQMNEEETAYLTAYTAATGTSALTAISELALLSTAISKNASRTYKINNAAGAIDTVAGDIRDGDGGIGALASKYVSRAQKDKERSARMEAMMTALAFERKNRSATKSCLRSKKGNVQSQETQDAVSSRRKASGKYSASVSKGIKKGKVQSQETQDAMSSRRKASGKYSASVSKGIKKSSRERKGERKNGSRKEGKMV